MNGKFAGRTALMAGIGIGVVAGFIAVSASANAAQPKHKARSPVQNTSTATAQIAGGGYLKNPGSNAIFSSRGYYIGSDPSPWMRNQLLRDPPGATQSVYKY